MSNTNLEAVLMAAQTTGSDDPSVLLRQALMYQNVAERFDYVSRLKRIDAQSMNLKELFPDWAARGQATVRTYDLRVLNVGPAMSNAGGTYDKHRITIEVPQAWVDSAAQEGKTPKNFRDTDWHNQGDWVPDYVAAVAADAAKTAAQCRIWQFTHEREDDRSKKQSSVVWIEQTSAGSLNHHSPAPANYEPAQQSQQPVPQAQATPGGQQPDQDQAQCTPATRAKLKTKIEQLDDQHRPILQDKWMQAQLPKLADLSMTERQAIAATNLTEEVLQQQFAAMRPPTDQLLPGETPF